MRSTSLFCLSGALFIAVYVGCSSGAYPIAQNGCGPQGTACFVVGADGSCTVDPLAACTNGMWQCSSGAVLGAGCAPDGGIIPFDGGADGATCSGSGTCADSGGCTLGAQMIGCLTDSTCTPYGAVCDNGNLTGPGLCACHASGGNDGGNDTGADGCGGGSCSDSIVGGSLPCGPTLVCDTATQYCTQTNIPTMPGQYTYACGSIPDVCLGAVTCTCLNANVSGPPCGCTQTPPGFTIFFCPP